MKKIAFLGYALFGILSFLQAQKDSVAQANQPKSVNNLFMWQLVSCVTK